MEATIITRMLILVNEQIKEEHVDGNLPRSVMVQADNTTREAKNQHFQMYLAYLKASGKFDATECDYLPAGHSHFEPDQRFSSVGTKFSHAATLKDPEEFCAWIQKEVPPCGGVPVKPAQAGDCDSTGGA